MLRYSLLIFVAIILGLGINFIYKVKFKFSKATLWTGLAVLASMLVFNTYLTALPIVVYNTNSILNIRILTFPIEDLGYLVVAVLVLPGLFNKLCNEDKSHKKHSTKP
ncbi:MAG: lycopene cyclase domain-containing protein [bacterium]